MSELDEYFKIREEELNKNSWFVYGKRIPFPVKNYELKVIKEIVKTPSQNTDLALIYTTREGRTEQHSFNSKNYNTTPAEFIKEFNRIKNMNHKTINIFGYKINVPENKKDIELTQTGWCRVNLKVPCGTTTINTDYLPKGQCTSAYFINEFNNQLNAILK